jgi:hypothetical protein
MKLSVFKTLEKIRSKEQDP